MADKRGIISLFRYKVHIGLNEALLITARRKQSWLRKRCLSVNADVRESLSSGRWLKGTTFLRFGRGENTGGYMSLAEKVPVFRVVLHLRTGSEHLGSLSR